MKKLTFVEQTTINMLAEGKSQQQIAAFFSVAPPTVSRRLAKIAEKLGARNPVHAVAIWTKGSE